MLMTRFVAFGLMCGLVGAISCRTTDASKEGGDASTVESAHMPPGAVGMPMQPYLVQLNDRSAADFYAKLRGEERVTSTGGKKTASGELMINCSRTGGGALPPNVQGMPAQVRYSCFLSPVSHMPPGAQGMPAQPLAQLDGQTAADFYNAFRVEEKNGTGGQKTKSFQGNASVQCQFALSHNVRSGYFCYVRKEAATNH